MDWSMLIYAVGGFLLRHFFAGSGIAMPTLPAIPSPSPQPAVPPPVNNSNLGVLLQGLLMELLAKKLSTGVPSSQSAVPNPAAVPPPPPHG